MKSAWRVPFPGPPNAFMRALLTSKTPCLPVTLMTRSVITRPPVLIVRHRTSLVNDRVFNGSGPASGPVERSPTVISTPSSAVPPPDFRSVKRKLPWETASLFRAMRSPDHLPLGMTILSLPSFCRRMETAGLTISIRLILTLPVMSGRSFRPIFMLATVATSEPPFVTLMSASEAPKAGKKETLTAPRTWTSIPKAFEAVASIRDLRTLGPKRRARRTRTMIARITPPAIKIIVFLRLAMRYSSCPEIDADPVLRRPKMKMLQASCQSSRISSRRPCPK